jgi:hypothetical protein
MPTGVFLPHFEIAIILKLLRFKNGDTYTKERNSRWLKRATLFGRHFFWEVILAKLWLVWPKNHTWFERELNELSFAFFLKQLAKSGPELFQF